MDTIFQERKGQYIVKGLKECIFRKLDEEFLLIVYKDNTAGDYRNETHGEGGESGVAPHSPLYSLNQSAALAWYFLKDCPTPGDLLKKLRAYYPDEKEEDIEKDLGNFFQKAYTLNLIQFSSELFPKATSSAFSSGLNDEKAQSPFKEVENYFSPEIKSITMKEPIAYGGVSPHGPASCPDPLFLPTCMC